MHFMNIENIFNLDKSINGWKCVLIYIFVNYNSIIIQILWFKS